MNGSESGELPLARLFAMAYRWLIDGLHEELRERGWKDVRPSFGFVLLATRQSSMTTTELAALMGTTKQAASKLVENMERAGYVRRAPSKHDARRRPVELTSRGRKLLDVVEDIYRELESQWAAVIGERRVEQLRRSLSDVLLHVNEGTLPPVRPAP